MHYQSYFCEQYNDNLVCKTLHLKMKTSVSHLQGIIHIHYYPESIIQIDNPPESDERC